MKSHINAILIALNSTFGGLYAPKYPIGNKELTQKTKDLEAQGKIRFNEFNGKWSKA